MSNTNIESVLLTLNNGVRIIKFNRPKLKNAINEEVFTTITSTLKSDAFNDDIVVTILTGSGDAYTSGLELKLKKFPDVDIIKNFISAFIDYPKLIIAVVNGPAVGIGVTMLPLCDVVYASNRSFFSTPFVKHEFSPESCSTYLFQRIMGRSKAMEMLLSGETMSAEDALNAKLISKIVPHEKLDELFKQLLTLNNLPVNSIKNIKRLLNAPLKDQLKNIHDKEMAIIRGKIHLGAYFQTSQKFKLQKNKL